MGQTYKRSDTFNAVFKGLVGKDVSGLSEDALVFNEGLLYDLNMGHYTPSTITPFSSALYRSIENEYEHPWSIKSSGYFYGLNKLKDTLSLKDYMTLPNCILEDLLTSVSKGESARFEMDNQAERETRPVDNLPKEMLEQLKAAGIDLSRLK